MTRPTTKLTREDIANLEVGQTDVSPRLARVVSALFVALIVVVPIMQMVRDARSYARGERSGSWCAAAGLLQWPKAGPDDPPGLFASNRKLLAHIQTWEKSLDENTLLRGWLLKPLQSVFCRVGLGNEKAILGREGWLYYEPDVDLLVGPAVKPDASVSALLDFQSQLASRGIKLLIVPIPSKAGVVPEKLASPVPAQAKVVEPRGMPRWREACATAGIEVWDPTPSLVLPGGESVPPYLRTDTHWTPVAMDRVAKAMAKEVERRAWLPPAPAVAGFSRDTLTVTNRGDIAVMLAPPDGLAVHPPESVQIHPVRAIDGRNYSPGPGAPILLLGDSFSNIFSAPQMGWGSNAGLAEQLAYHLQRPVDALLINDNGAHASRDLLARDLASGQDRLAGVKVVVWTFAARELGIGDWKKIPLPSVENKATVAAPEGELWSPAAGASVQASARVVRGSNVPKPGTVAYADHIRMLHLADLKGPDGKLLAGQCVAYAQSMEKHRWTVAASWAPGDVVQVKLRPWSEMEARMGTLNRSDIDDETLLFAEPAWAEPVDQPKTGADTQARARPPLVATLVGLFILLAAGLVGFLRENSSALRRT